MAELVLFESAAGYGLLEVVSWEDAAADQAADSLSRFSRAMKLKAIHPFANAMEALENANAISEHAMSETLANFLEMNVKRNKKATLGVIDPALATAIAEGTGISCRSDERVREVIRGCRMHWDHFSKTKSSNHDKAQLGLGHAYSRSKVKFNPARADNMIIQSIALLDTLDKDVNTFAMRVREWYSWHFPELKLIVKDNVQYARVAAYVGDRTTLGGTEDKLPGLTALLNDDAMLAEQIIAASKHSMGVDCNETDMLNICNFTTRMVQLATYRHKLSLYLHDKMTTVAPNLSALIGDTVAARLISKAGSLTSLAKAPASTVQILGAEKALFRALKTKGNTPKYGLIYHSTFIGRAEAKNKGRISRYLANKCSMAVRIDSFSDTPTSAYGVQLRNQVEERLKFYETGAAPKRNIDVMEAVAKELKKARQSGDDEMDLDDDHQEEQPSSDKKSKKKKKAKDEAKDDDDNANATPVTATKRKADVAIDDDDEEEKADKSAKKSAKKEKKEKKKSKKSKKSIE